MNDEVLKFFNDWAKRVGFGQRLLIMEYGAESFRLVWQQKDLTFAREVPFDLLLDADLSVGVSAEMIADDCREIIRKALEKRT